MRRLILSFSVLSMSTLHAAPKATIVADEEKAERVPLAYHAKSVNGVNLHLVSFDSRDFQLEVADQANGPGSLWADSASAAKANGAVAAINAGFFTPEGKPLGKLIANGTPRGHNNPSSLGSGFLYFGKAHAGIARRKSLNHFTKKFKPSNLLQAGPMLCYRSKKVTGLSNNRARPRSFVASNGSYQWLIGYAESATLDQLGGALQQLSIHGNQVHHALNLDGGRSSDLWISSSVQDGNKTFRGFFNKPVRNFLVLTKK